MDGWASFHSTSDKIPNKGKGSFEENSDGNYEMAIKEAEFLVEDYLKKLEKPKEIASIVNVRRMKLQYKKMQICSMLLGITTIIRNNN